MVSFKLIAKSKQSAIRLSLHIIVHCDYELMKSTTEKHQTINIAPRRYEKWLASKKKVNISVLKKMIFFFLDIEYDA